MLKCQTQLPKKLLYFVLNPVLINCSVVYKASYYYDDEEKINYISPELIEMEFLQPLISLGSAVGSASVS